MENVAGEQSLALQQRSPHKSSHSCKYSNCHKFSFFNDGGLKLGHFDILDRRFPLWHSLSYSPSELSEKRSRDGLATKGP